MPGSRWRPLLGGLGLWLAPSCAGELDTTRRQPPPSTLGDDVYGVLCDRVGASVLAEDLAGVSYRSVCHRGAAGAYADTVDESRLPPVSGASAETRRLAVAKLHALARRRDDLIRAIDATFDDGDVPIPFGSGSVRGHAALSTMLKALLPLQETNPVAGGGEPLLPGVTRATGRLFAGLGGPGADGAGGADPAVAGSAQAALAALSGRQGYRPLRVVLGALRPVLAYPGLRAMAQTLAPRVAPGGPLHDAMQNLFGMTQSELVTSVQQPLAGPYVVEPLTVQPSRVRSNTEVGRAMLLATDPAFAASGAPARHLVRRDWRGVAIPAGNVPGVPGTVVGPFADSDGDGVADADAFGRLLAPGGGLAAADPPFLIPGLVRLGAPDAFGRAVDASGAPLYEYLDTSQTLAASLLRDLEPLLDPDPARQGEIVADLLSGAFRLYGDPVPVPAPWAVGGAYPGFGPATSPIVDLIHAVGQLLADRRSDAWLALFERVVNEHEGDVAWLTGELLRVREISNQHPEATLAPSDTFWDEMAEIVVAIAKKPALLKGILRAIGAPVRPPDDATPAFIYLGPALASFARHKDRLSYDPANLNGPPIDLDAAGQPVDPQLPVDRSAPDAGENRSLLHRTFQIIHDVNGVNACNKEGARIRVKLGPVPVTYPPEPLPGFGECELFVFENMGLVYFDAVLGKARLEVKDSVMNGLITFLETIPSIGIIPSSDEIFETSSGITGMTLSPTAPAFNRLVFFGAETTLFDPLFGGALPDRDPLFDTTNDDTNKFVSRLVDAVSTTVCPTHAAVEPSVAGLPLADCSIGGADPNDLLRLRDLGTIFAWEKHEFYAALTPLLRALDDEGEAALFLELNEVLYRHWPSEQHGPECQKSGSFRPSDPQYNPRYCAESGLSRYEPLLAEVFETDVLAALARMVEILEATEIQDPRSGTTRNGLDIVVEITQALFDPDQAAAAGVVDRNGVAATTWADGTTPKPQTTPFDLFANALSAIDARLSGDPRHERWRRARSRLVDTFFTVDPDGSGGWRFRNRAVPKAIPILVRVLREQINANCPDREASGQCAWGRSELAAKAAETFGGAPFATTMTLLDLLDQDEPARREVERLLLYLIQSGENDAQHATVTAIADLLQLLGDEQSLPPLYNAVAVAAAPEAGTTGSPGTADRVLQLVHALTEEPTVDGQPQRNAYDPYRMLDRILRNLVTPIDPASPESQTPIEVFLDVIAEVNRHDASLPRGEPLDARDFGWVFGTLRDVMLDRTRGFEQFYEVVRHRDGR